MNKNQNGQVVLGLILVMVVALGVGLSIIQKSLVDLSTSTKIEESSRSFSAAEAGIEQALSCKGNPGCASTVNFTENGSQANVIDTGLIPVVPHPSSTQIALEFPVLSKEDVAQIWLADYTASTNPPPAYYKLNQLVVYWGMPVLGSDVKPALEIKIVKYNATSGYTAIPFYLDSDSARAQSSNFTDASANCISPAVITTSSGANRSFLCRSVLSGWDSSVDTLMLARTRFLYSSVAQPLAVQGASAPSGVICADPNSGCYLPSQARILVSTGTAGQTQRRVMLFQQNQVVSPYFDYAIFSAGTISKK